VIKVGTFLIHEVTLLDEVGAEKTRNLQEGTRSKGSGGEKCPERTSPYSEKHNDT